MAQQPSTGSTRIESTRTEGDSIRTDGTREVDALAVKAMQGLAFATAAAALDPKAIARRAYDIAEAMLSERARRACAK
jgi:hypothetical protein